MFYALLKPDGSLDRYPYTLTDLRRSVANVSFPKVIDDATAASFNCLPVTPAVQPEDDYRFNLERTAIKDGANWVEQWIQTPATQEQIDDRTTAKAADIRDDRNRRLADCDWTQLPDAPVDHTEWATYRQALRDVSSQPGFPWSVEWPQQP
jgi:hypothetical protein